MISSELSYCLKIITAYFLFLMFYSISIVYKINKNTFWLQFFFKKNWIEFSLASMRNPSSKNQSMSFFLKNLWSILTIKSKGGTIFT